jgi:hypothetical protein
MKFISKLMLIAMIICSAGFIDAMQRAAVAADLNEVIRLLPDTNDNELAEAKMFVNTYRFIENDKAKRARYEEIENILREELKNREEIR